MADSGGELLLLHRRGGAVDEHHLQFLRRRPEGQTPAPEAPEAPDKHFFILSTSLSSSVCKDNWLSVT